MQLQMDFGSGWGERVPHPFRRDAYVINVGGWRNCVIYGADTFPPTDGEFVEDDLLCLEFPLGNPFIDKMRSEAWSANCSHFLLFQESGCFLVPVFPGVAFVCRNRSLDFMQACLRGLEASESMNFGKRARKR